ncbi:MAG: DegT/DnrJ/EryC1/StrS family aminotransferase, partial [Phaeodactylibacter sp.]|nr:DegT/DnrJ/EryC1/StrS family aminotransferase [Phaeodactylibacter sp.]
YLELLAPYGWAELPIWRDADRSSSCHLFLLRIKGVSLEQRNAIIEHIFDQEVSVNVHYKPLPLLSYYRNAGYQMDDYPVSKDWWERVITLPLFYDLEEEQLARVVKAVAYAVEQVLQPTS